MTLKDRIIKAREARGWRQKTLAEVLIAYDIMTQQSLSQLESGRALRTRRLVDLAWALGVSPVWLATGEGQMEQQNEGTLAEFSERIVPLFAQIDALDRAGKLSPQMLTALTATVSAFNARSTTENAGDNCANIP